MRIEYGPLLGARLARRYATFATRVRTDDDLGLVDLFRLARIRCLIIRVLEKLIDETHSVCALRLVLWTLVLGLWS